MATVKITLIPVMNSKYYNSFTDDEKLKKLCSFIDKFEFIKKRHLEYVIEQLSDFEPRLKFKTKKGIIEFESNNWRLDLRNLTDASILDEVEKIEIVRD